MLPQDERWPVARPVFDPPLTNLPLVEPDATPTSTLTLNCSWWPYLLGAVQALRQQATWSTPEPSDLELTLQRVDTLMYLIAEAGQAGDCSDDIPPIACNYDFAEDELTDFVYLTPLPPFGFPDPCGHWTSTVGFQSDYNGGEPPGSEQVIYIEIRFAGARHLASVSASFVVDTGYTQTVAHQNIRFITTGNVQETFAFDDVGTRTVQVIADRDDIDRVWITGTIDVPWTINSIQIVFADGVEDCPT